MGETSRATEREIQSALPALQPQPWCSLCCVAQPRHAFWAVMRGAHWAAAQKSSRRAMADRQSVGQGNQQQGREGSGRSLGRSQGQGQDGQRGMSTAAVGDAGKRDSGRVCRY